MKLLSLKWIDRNLNYDIQGDVKDLKKLFVEIALGDSFFKDILLESSKQVELVSRLKNALTAEDVSEEAKKLINKRK